MRRSISRFSKPIYFAEDVFQDTQAKYCGWNGNIIYHYFCRRVDKKQTCFPSINKMSEDLGICRDSVIKGIKKLKERNVISVKKNYRKYGKKYNNTYTLLDKKLWLYNEDVEKIKNESTLNENGSNINNLTKDKKDCTSLKNYKKINDKSLNIKNPKSTRSTVRDIISNDIINTVKNNKITSILLFGESENFLKNHENSSSTHEPRSLQRNPKSQEPLPQWLVSTSQPRGSGSPTNPQTPPNCAAPPLSPFLGSDKQAKISHSCQECAFLLNKKKYMKKNEEEFNYEEYLEKMLLDDKRHIRVIASYLQLKGDYYPSKKAVCSAIKRFSRAATIVAEYSDEEIEATFEFFDKNKFYDNDNWTLDTMVRKIPMISSHVRKGEW